MKQLRTSYGGILPNYVHPSRLDAPRRCEREHGLVVPAVSESHTVRVDSGSHTDDLVSHADTEDWFVPLFRNINAASMQWAGSPGPLLKNNPSY